MNDLHIHCFRYTIYTSVIVRMFVFAVEHRAEATKYSHEVEDGAGVSLNKQCFDLSDMFINKFEQRSDIIFKS